MAKTSQSSMTKKTIYKILRCKLLFYIQQPDGLVIHLKIFSPLSPESPQPPPKKPAFRIRGIDLPSDCHLAPQLLYKQFKGFGSLNPRFRATIQNTDTDKGTKHSHTQLVPVIHCTWATCFAIIFSSSRE
jgi:hypothetical protein